MNLTKHVGKREVAYTYNTCLNCTNYWNFDSKFHNVHEYHNAVCIPIWFRLTGYKFKPPVLSKTARLVINDACRAMLTHPESVDMFTWVDHDEKVSKNPDGVENYCGTTACAAGHIGIACGLPPYPEALAKDIRNAPHVP